MASTRVEAADVQITGILDMRQNNITDLETDLAVYPTQPDDGATKKYVDSVRDGIVANLPNNADNGTY